MGSLEVLGGHVQIVEDERIRMLVQVLETLLEMRTQRMGLIQTEDQLRFSVEALILALKRLQGEEVSWPFVGGSERQFKTHICPGRCPRS